MPKLTPAKWQAIIIALAGAAAAIVHAIAPGTGYAHAVDLVAALLTGGAIIPRPQEGAKRVEAGK